MFQSDTTQARVIFLTSHVPYPANMGDKIVTLNTLLGFRELGWDVHILSFGDSNDCESVGALKTLGIPVTLVPIPNKVIAVAKAILSFRRGAIFGRFYSNAFAESVKTLSSDADVIFAHHSYMAQYFATSSERRILKIQDIHVVESEVLRKRSLGANPLFRCLLNFELARLITDEERTYKLSDACYAYGEIEVSRLSKKFGNIFFRHAPIKVANSVKFKLVSDRPTFTFFGDYRWFPNVDGLQYVLCSVWPAIKEKIPNARLVIAGRYCPEDLQQMTYRLGGEFRGEVSSMDDFLSEVDVLLSPIRVGGGVRLKILESLARGMVVVTNQISSEGISDKSVMLIDDTPGDLARRIEILLQQPDMFRDFQKAAREYAVSNHGVTSTTRELINSWRALS